MCECVSHAKRLRTSCNFYSFDKETKGSIMKRVTLIILLGTLLAYSAHAAEIDTPREYRIVIKDHKFIPAEITAPAGKKISLIIKNEDKTVAEFESDELKREKIVSGGGEVRINLNPLKPGRYAFYEDFHQATGQGVLIVK